MEALSMRAAFVPNGHVSSRIYALLMGGTLASLFLAWAARPAFLPGPGDVAQAFPALLEDGLLFQTMTSITTNAQAIALSCLLTVPLAYLTVVPAVRPFVRVLSKLRFLGLTGFVLLFTILFGGGHGLKLALLVFGISTFLVTSLYDIVEAIPREEFDYARTLRLGKWGCVYEVVIRGRLDIVLDAVRQNAAMGWVMLTMSEGLVRSEGGLGAMMLTQDKHFQLASVFALQAVVLIVGILQDQFLVFLRAWLCPYANLTLERQ
jgi:NitT/TauT family transport system permease protein